MVHLPARHQASFSGTNHVKATTVVLVAWRFADWQKPRGTPTANLLGQGMHGQATAGLLLSFYRSWIQAATGLWHLPFSPRRTAVDLRWPARHRSTTKNSGICLCAYYMLTHHAARIVTPIALVPPLAAGVRKARHADVLVPPLTAAGLEAHCTDHTTAVAHNRMSQGSSR